MKKFYTKQFSVSNTSLSLMCFTVLLLLSVFNGYSQVIVDFTPRQNSFNIQGDFSMIGNTNLTLSDYDDTSSNGEDMRYVDIDGDSRTFNSSSSVLEFSTESGALVECSNIVYAGLYWTGRASLDGADANEDGDGNPDTFSVTKDAITKDFNKRKVLFKGPGFNYEEITATGIEFPDDESNNMYAAYADVTDLLIANEGAGVYTVADIATIEGNGYPTGYYGGWGLVVVYENYKMKWRDISVFDGFAYVSSGGGDEYIDISGFKAVEEGDVNIKLGVMAGEGDVGVGGDRLSIMIRDTDDVQGIPATFLNNSYRDLVHPGNTVDNFFNSSIYTHNGAPGKRTPDLNNNTGVDIAVFNIENSDKSLIENGQNYTRFKYNSTQDTYIIFNATFAVDAYIPEPEGVITATTVNGTPPTSLEPTESAEYIIDIKNRGSEATNNTVVTIPLPDSVNPNDLNINTKSSIIPAPTSEIDPTIGTNGAIVWNIGTLPVPLDPDTVLASISFSLTVTTDCDFYQDDEDKFVSVNGKISGVGAISGAPFDLTLIQGYEMSGNCIGASIAAPIIIPINYKSYVDSPPTGDAPADIMIDCGEVVPVADTALVTNLQDNSGETPIVAFVEDVSNNATPEVITRTYSITDDCGNVTNVTQQITRMPSPPPTAMCQDIDVILDATGNATITAEQIDNGSSPCSGAVTLSASQTEFTCSSVGVNTVTLTVTDVSGQTATCDATVTVIDDINPEALCQPVTIYLDAAGVATLAPSDIDNGSNDICGIKSLEVDKDTFSCTDLGTNTVTLTVTDNSDNVSTCTAEVTVVDNIPPTAICANITVQLDASGNASINPEDIDGGSSDNCSTITFSASKTAFTCDDLGVNSVTLMVTDANSLETTCTAEVTVVDSIAPEAICFNEIDVAIDSAGNASITVADINNGSTDNCSIDSITIDKTNFDCSNIGANTVTLTVTDASGNSDTCTTTVNIVDNQGPAVACKSITVELDANGLATIVPGDVDDGSSDCSGLSSTALSQTTFDCSNLGDNNVTLTVTDNVGNVDSCVAVVTVVDNIKPTVICQNTVAQLDATGNVSISAADVDNGSNDACGIDTLTLDVTDFTCDNIGVNTVTLTATDVNGNSETCTATVTIEDNVPPAALCQAITIQLDATGNATITPDQIDNGSTDSCGVANTELDITTFNCDNVGANTVELTVTDNNGNTSTCTTTVTVEDVTPPTALCQAITVQLDATGNVTITPEQIDNGSSDSCDIASLTLDTPTFDCSNIGDNTVELTVTDINGNSATCTTTVTVEDNIAPTVICQDIVVQLNSSGIATITAENVDNGSNDTCTNITLSVSETSFDCSNVGANTVTLTAVDAYGNEATCDATVTVEDNVAPVIACKNITVRLDETGSVTIEPSDIDDGSSDCSSEVTLAASQTVFDCSNIGANTVTLTVTDAYGNAGTCDALVTVLDIVPPTAICQAITVQLDADGNATITPEQIDNGSNDACGIQDLSLDITTFDCSNIGDNTVELTVTDNNDNVSTCTAIVTVEDTIAPEAICKDITIQLNSAGNANIVASDIDGGSTDNCGIPALSASQLNFTCADVGANTVTLTVTDSSGNEDTCTATVTVEDTIDPTVECKNITVQLDNTGTVSILPEDVDNGSADCSGEVSLSVSQSTFDCSNIGENTVTLTVTDVNGNDSFCDAIVTVEDITPPTAICQAITVQLDVDGNAIITPDQIDNGSNDACGIQDISLDITTFDCSNIGDNTVELTVTDNNNNISTCSAIVTVEDNIAPEAICQSITIQLDANGSATIVARDLDNGSNDNCGTVTLAASQTFFTCTDVGDNNVTLEVTDANNNVSTCTAIVTVEDNLPPTILCQDITVQLDSSGLATIVASDIDGGSTDACGTVSLTASQTNFDCSNIGNVIVTLTATDVNGNSSTCDATVTVEDNIAPTITCPSDVVITADAGQCTATNVDLGLTTTTDNCEVATITNNALEPFVLGETIVTWTVTDTSGNETTCEQKVTVTDGNLPEVVCPEDVSVFVDADSCNATNVELGTLDIEDCTSVIVVNDAPETFPIGDTLVTWTVTDSEGNISNCTQTVTVVDNIPPTFVEELPAETITIECNVVPTPETFTGADNCTTPAVTFNEERTDGSCTNNYTLVRTWTVTDAANLTTSFVQTITVQDTTAPTFVGDLPSANLVTECDEVPTAETLTAEDSCGTATVTVQDIITNGDCASNYTIARVWTAEDECENKTSYTQIISVRDTTLPVFDAPLPAETLEVECDAIPNAETLTATDNCGNASVEVNDVRTDGDCPSNYTITRTWTATDDCGLVAEHTQIITVTDTTAPTPTTTFDAVLDVSCTDIPEVPTIEFTDNCSDDVTIEYSETNSFDKTVLVDYQIVRSWKVTDACDNSETYTQTLNVALDEIYSDIVAPDWCYKEGVLDLNEFIDPALDTDGTWELLEGDLRATLTNNLFDPSTLELSADFLPNDGGIDYLFRYSTTNNGCISITEITMNIHADCDVLPCGENDIEISTAITPNGDGINDTFDISGIDLCGFVASVKIFNRWGAIVYESSNYTLGSMSTSGSEGDWDGYSPTSAIGNNGKLPNGTYYYIIHLQDSGLAPLTGPIYLGTK
ncbi:HYR domain-containing protein [Algibacter lectus]|uniref:HYR domain-containing protein n=1 Tax=Algibacter lectus TaxID=221126 RepID=UPI0026EEEFD8|nr:HYR domain-containing protein [Algibacter lectus]MDO7136207.1 HYR domain-containing protein [Algibacter lectus]